MTQFLKKQHNNYHSFLLMSKYLKKFSTKKIDIIAGHEKYMQASRQLKSVSFRNWL